MYLHTVEHSYNKPKTPGQTVCYKQEFVISEQFPMRYCSTWLRSLLCYIEEFVIREFHCITYVHTYVCMYASVHMYVYMYSCTLYISAPLIQDKVNNCSRN